MIIRTHDSEGAVSCPPLSHPSATTTGRSPRGASGKFGAVLRQLRAERTKAQLQLERLDEAISLLEGSSGGSSRVSRHFRRRTMSADVRRHIAEAQRRRWVTVKGTRAKPRKRALSPAARRRIAAAQKARWAKSRTGRKRKALPYAGSGDILRERRSEVARRDSNCDASMVQEHSFWKHIIKRL